MFVPPGYVFLTYSKPRFPSLLTSGMASFSPLYTRVKIITVYFLATTEKKHWPTMPIQKCHNDVIPQIRGFWVCVLRAQINRNYAQIKQIVRHNLVKINTLAVPFRDEFVNLHNLQTVTRRHKLLIYIQATLYVANTIEVTHKLLRTFTSQLLVTIQQL